MAELSENWMRGSIYPPMSIEDAQAKIQLAGESLHAKLGAGVKSNDPEVTQNAAAEMFAAGIEFGPFSMLDAIRSVAIEQHRLQGEI
ncbi:MAG: hypothetical protein WC498_03220 [Candidatus Saccharimonadales bacterium]